MNPAFILLTTVYFHLPCRAKKCNIFRARIWCYFLLKDHTLLWCLVIAHYIIALALQWSKNAHSFQCIEKHFPLPWVTAVKHQIRLQIKSLFAPCSLWELSGMGSAVNIRGRNLSIPVFGEKEGIWVTGAFWNCFFYTFQLLKVPWHKSISFF